MAVTDLFGPSLPILVQANSTRTILTGDPPPNGDIGRNAYWSVFVVPQQGTPAGFDLEVVRTQVVEVQGLTRLRFTVRNNNPAQPVSFVRFAIRVRP
jgi:hypothetical protein